MWRQTITATPRQLESLIRISEALARMRLSATVERADAAEALRLMQVWAPSSAPVSAEQPRAVALEDKLLAAAPGCLLHSVHHLRSNKCIPLPHHPPGHMHPAWLLASAEQAYGVRWSAGGYPAGSHGPCHGRHRHGPHPDRRVRLGAHRARPAGSGDQEAAHKSAPLITHSRTILCLLHSIVSLHPLNAHVCNSILQQVVPGTEDAIQDVAV